MTILPSIKNGEMEISLANIFMESEEAQITTIFGSSNCRAFRTGYRFELQDYFREDMNDKSYVLTEISHIGLIKYFGDGKRRRRNL